jgi:AraC family transcriptional activator of mtrCDE
LPAGTERRAPLRLEAGDVLLLPHGDAHVVHSSTRMRGPKSLIRIEHGNAIETKTNTQGKAATELICGRLHFEAATESLGSRRCRTSSC